jgi:hypothetical protein
MFGRRGYAMSFCIGVAKKGDEFGAHAWVECEGGSVVGSGAGFAKLLILSSVQS